MAKKILRKRCTGCNRNKTLDRFYKAKQYKFGVRSKCIGCTKIDSINYYRTKNGLLKALYTSRKHAAKKENTYLQYTPLEFNTWCTANGFDALHADWKENDYTHDKVPTVFLVDAKYTTRTLDNLSLGSYSKYLDCISIPVMQFDPNGKVIDSFKSITEAERITKVNKDSIRKARDHSHLTGGNFRWASVEEYYNVATIGES